MLPLSYLATPYSRYPGGLMRAFIEAAALTGNLIRLGRNVYSPICHTHPAAIHSGLDPLDHSLWLEFDKAMMERCDDLIVAQMDSWADSRGIWIEIDAFDALRKPVGLLDTLTMAIDWWPIGQGRAFATERGMR